MLLDVWPSSLLRGTAHTAHRLQDGQPLPMNNLDQHRCTRHIVALATLVLAGLSGPAHGQDERHVLQAPAALSVPPALDVPYTQTVDPARYVDGAVSVGTTSDGRLRNASQLPLDGDNHYVLPEHQQRDTHWGTDELVAVLLDAAQAVQDTHGGRTGIGNMSGPSGGDIRWSRSHNNGRDADVAFFVLDEAGAHVEATTLYTARRDGTFRGRQGLRFDVARGWTLVEALLTNDIAQVQWIFIYDPLKQALLEHARAIDADPTVIALASDILHQPGDSAPHDDHFHIRLFCSRADRLEGCANWGPEWHHAHLWEDAVDARVHELLRGLGDPSIEAARECLDRLQALNGETIAHELGRALPHVQPLMQLAIMDRLAEFDVPGVTGPLVALLESSPEAQVRSQAAWLLGYLADPASAGPLAELVLRGGSELADGQSLRHAAAHALRNVFEPDFVSSLLAGIQDADDAAVIEINRVLARTTGAAPANDLGAEEVRAYWNTWGTDNTSGTQEGWYFAAFEALGYTGYATEWEDVPLAELLIALEDEADHIRFIADRTLKARTGSWTPSEGWTIERRLGFWRDRLRR